MKTIKSFVLITGLLCFNISANCQILDSSTTPKKIIHSISKPNSIHNLSENLINYFEIKGKDTFSTVINVKIPVCNYYLAPENEKELFLTDVYAFKKQHPELISISFYPHTTHQYFVIGNVIGMQYSLKEKEIINSLPTFYKLNSN